MKVQKVAVVLAIGFLTVFGSAQDATKKDAPPKPPSSPSQALLDNWNDVGRKLIAMAEDFPEDKYDFKPTAGAAHICRATVARRECQLLLHQSCDGTEAAHGEDPKREQYKTKAAVVEFVKKAFADGATAIKQKGDKGLSDLIVDPYANQQVRVSDVAWGLLEHSGEHYGQLVVYYRVAGLVPPESRPKK